MVVSSAGQWWRRCRFHANVDRLNAGGRSGQRLRPELQQLVAAYREQGYRSAAIDPLALALPADDQGLALARFGLRPDEPVSAEGLPVPGATSAQALEAGLQALYCGPLSLDCSAVREDARRDWLFAEMEATATWPARELQDRGEWLLGQLVAAQDWEQLVARRFPQGKRFSLEGLEALIPLLHALIDAASAAGVRQVILGMPHRGRLNVLANVMGMPAAELVSAFDLLHADNLHQSDLIYHRGSQTRLRTAEGELALWLLPNPSHLQSVQPVVLGLTRALQEHAGQDGEAQTLALTLHGDAALAGQGVVMESLMLGLKPGYAVGGTVHVVINNQVGFTEANEPDGRLARYCTNVARMIDAPVLRVNAEAPEQLHRAAQLALGYRCRFAADVFIDLVGYRRLGHSESDVPELTHPRRQVCIDQAPTAVESLLARLQRAGVADAARRADWTARAHAQAAERFGRAPEPLLPSPAQPLAQAPLPSQAELQEMLWRMTTLPPGFEPHALVRTLIEDWRSMVTEPAARVDWRFAENMAYASLLRAGLGIRISGLDVQRGTFFHRMAVWSDQRVTRGQGGAEFMPLAQVMGEGARLDVVNSPLTEEAVLGFEYGYSVGTRRQLVVWEAQFGDFVNGAQVFLDQYIASGEAKWGQASGLTLLLPHGHEGVGPEHSNGFLSRILLLCAEDNLRVACPSTPAQFYHLLRRQALSVQRRPLVVLTPKSTLHEEPESYVSLSDMLAGGFAEVLDDAMPEALTERVERVLLCSGKVYHDLCRARRHEGRRAERLAILRLEQFYPFPRRRLGRLLTRYPEMRELVWVQEEQLLQGAWPVVRDELQALCPPGVALRCVAPPPTAVGAAASLSAQRTVQQGLMVQALA
jgi:2-oxoglutarate dehydrogenase E1 component